MTAAYVLEDGIVGTAASGLADVQANVPMTDNTGLLSASIGKSFVGALCVALALEGRLHWHPAVEWTGGGLVSTSRDLARWGAALFSGEAMTGDYLSELLRTVAVDPDLTDVTYGAGVAVYSSGPFGPVYGHAGWIPGYVSSLLHYPEHGVTIAFQINTDKGIIDSDDDVLGIIEER